MMYSAQVSMGDDYDPAEEETAFEKWVGDHLGKKATANCGLRDCKLR